MFRILVIAHNTFTEVIRQPIYLLIIGVAFGLIMVSPYITMFALLDNLKLIKDMTLATLLMAGLLISAFSASSVIYQEIENKTVFTVITKPIHRSDFVVGKYLGIAGGLLTATYLLSLISLHIVRTKITEAKYSDTDYPVLFGYLAAAIIALALGAYSNFFYEKPFISSTTLFALPVFTFVFLLLCVVDNEWQLQSFAKGLDTNILLAAILVFLATSVLAAIAVALSTRLSPIPTVAIAFFFFLLGLFSDYLFGQYSEQYWIADFLYKIIPNLQIYWVMDALIENRDVPLQYIWYVLGYTVFFLIAIISIAILLFQERETS